MKIKGAIFDLDGTLLDSMNVWKTLASDYLISRNIVPEKNLDEKFKTFSMEQGAQYYRTKYGLTESPDFLIENVNRMIEYKYENSIELKKGVKEFLEFLYNKGVKMCVATASSKKLTKLALERNDILKYFVDIITCEDVGISKNSPYIFEKALEIINTNKLETIVFEDSLHAIETAKKAGFRVAAVYDLSAKEEEEEIKKISDYYFRTFKDGRKIYD
jgi:HAD superfamily hydrolase (TIGR01509 family)